MDETLQTREDPAYLRWLSLSGLAFVVVCLALLVQSMSQAPIAYVAAIEENLSLLEVLRGTEDIVAAIELSEKKNSLLSTQQILELDRQWRDYTNASNSNVKSLPPLRLVEEVLRNEASASLKEFQNKYPAFIEIFLTDSAGRNVAATNPTSDYFQADEEWWVQTFKGRLPVIEKIEYDESARQWVLPIFIPIQNKRSENIGVMKALLNVSRIY